MTTATNYGDISREYSTYQTAKVVIIPVPYDRTSTWIKGAEKGPAAIIAASANMELYDIETDSEPYKAGMYTDQPITIDQPPEKMVEAVARTVRRHLQQDKFAVVLGGEHSVSIGSVRAHAERHPGLTVLQLDAHCDLRDEYDNSRFNHACVMARIKEICPFVQVGIRSMDSSEKEVADKQNIFFAKDIYNTTDWIETVLSRLSEKVYITIDLDVFDPAIMPSTGTPEAGGLSWYTVLGLLKALADKKEIVGFDVVELCPSETNKSPDFLAAKLVYKLLSYKLRG